MAKVLKLFTYPDPLLKEISKEVTDFSKELKSLTDDMFKTMYENSGIGLAAPQVGILKRIVVIDLQEDDKKVPLIFINPQIIEACGSTTFEEGCLSVPGYHEVVKRKKDITVKFQDLEGKEQVINATGLLAICLQHEIDHLNGILFVDQISQLKKGFF
ncbi:MAG: peptide deformylase, partial [Bdellovibrionota bacterium]|nr:peptide deformylase [Pseudomonadota bacterium]MDY6089873.1 peptide deformylase [Bdellovibrionota bacterium]